MRLVVDGDGDFPDFVADPWFMCPRTVDLTATTPQDTPLEIDLQGARQVRETMPDALFVFLAPPSWEELVRRLVGRGTESEDERRRRLETALEELAAEPEFDVTVVNRDVRTAAEELVSLMGSDPDSAPATR